MSLPDFKGKKILVFGLGILGGGVATTNWLLKQGALVTVTDLKNKEQLEESLEKLQGEVHLRLGGHTKEDIDANDVIVMNPDVSVQHELMQYAVSQGKSIENEATIFYKLFPGSIAAVTGTRGKTTTTTWLHHFIACHAAATIAGNSPEWQFLKVLDQHGDVAWAVTEVPSFHLELFQNLKRGPDVAVITNISPDHLNRHGTLEHYAATKANIFKNQTADQHLVLNHDNQWVDFFVQQQPQADIWYFSRKTKLDHGLFIVDDDAFFQEKDSPKKVLDVHGFVTQWGEHNLENLLASALAAHLAGIPWKKIQAAIPTLPSIQFRQEVVYKDDHLVVINDTTATSPEGGIAALKRFGGQHTILIAGGTDRNLDFASWTDAVIQHITPGNLILIGGSATDKIVLLLRERGWDGASEEFSVQESLAASVAAGLEKAHNQEDAVLLFSPAAKSFEKFLNEFDRGAQFSALIRKELKP